MSLANGQKLDDDPSKNHCYRWTKTLYPKTSKGDLGFTAEFEDSEGNRIALSQTTD